MYLSNLWRKLTSRPYRNAFVAEQLLQGIPFQIRVLRNKRGWSQAQLATASGLPQQVIARSEDPDDGRLTFNIVLKIANGLDMAFVGRFVSFGALVDYFENELSEEAVQHIPTFAEEEDQLRI